MVQFPFAHELTYRLPRGLPYLPKTKPTRRMRPRATASSKASTTSPKLRSSSPRQAKKRVRRSPINQNPKRPRKRRKRRRNRSQKRNLQRNKNQPITRTIPSYRPTSLPGWIRSMNHKMTLMYPLGSPWISPHVCLNPSPN